MNRECSIVQDLLPLYAERMVRDETAAFVEDHLKTCQTCRKEYEQTRDPRPAPLPSDGAAPLRNLSRKLRARRIQTIALTAVFVAALIVSALSVLFAPVYLPYSKGLVTIGEYGSDGVLLTFDPSVRHMSYRIGNDPDGRDFRICYVEAWTTLWDRWFSSGSEPLSSPVVSADMPLLIFYLPNDGSEDICLASFDSQETPPIQTDVTQGGSVTLPRLALGYYLMIAVAALAVLTILWFVLRKQEKLRVWVERIWLYPAAYIVSHFVVSGIRWSTYSLPWNFSFTIFLSLLLYTGLLLIQNLLKTRRELREAGL